MWKRPVVRANLGVAAAVFGRSVGVNECSLRFPSMVIEEESKWTRTTTAEIEPTTLSQPITDTIHYDNIGGCFIDSITLDGWMDGCLEGAKWKIDSTNFHRAKSFPLLRHERW